MVSPKQSLVVAASCLITVLATGTAGSDELEFDNWRPFSARAEIRPEFSINPRGGPDRQGGLVIELDERPGLDGAWSRTFQVCGDSHYQLTAHCRTERVTNPRYCTYVELLFHDADGNLVLDPRINPSVVGRVLAGANSNRFVGASTGIRSRPFYPPVVKVDDRNWARFSDVFQAPSAATHATVKLHLRWQPGAKVEWGGLSFVKSTPRPRRKIRLAAANYRPRGGKTTLDNLRQLEPHVAEAAKQEADLLVLGECITSVGNGLTYREAAEPVPGPSTKFLGNLAREYDLYLVTTIHERVDHLIYNTAVMLGPEGELVGKYRKVCPARDEYRRGIAPGSGYPVFETAIGRVGMMICFDVHEPEVARGLGANGAEIIAMPIMGGHPALARARAIENQVYLVTSSYSINDDWMQSGVWGLSGELMVRATDPDTVVVAEVDLAERQFWPANMGEFRGRLRHERPGVALPK